MVYIILVLWTLRYFLFFSLNCRVLPFGKAWGRTEEEEEVQSTQSCVYMGSSLKLGTDQLIKMCKVNLKRLMTVVRREREKQLYHPWLPLMVVHSRRLHNLQQERSAAAKVLSAQDPPDPLAQL